MGTFSGGLIGEFEAFYGLRTDRRLGMVFLTLFDSCGHCGAQLLALED